MPDETIKHRNQGKPLAMKPYLPTVIALAMVGFFLGLWGGLSDPEDPGWQEHFRYTRAFMTGGGLLATLGGAVMGWQEARLKGLIFGGAVSGLLVVIGIVFCAYAPYVISIITGYLAGGAGKAWSAVIGALLGSAMGLIPFAVALVRRMRSP
jgi:hypothetical protein